MTIAPLPPLGEKFRGAQYEQDVAQNNRRRGPLRFEEGVATDTDIPNDFRLGAYGDCSNPQPVTCRKDPATTQRERVHMGSSTWIEAPTLLSEFVQGAHMFGTGFSRVGGSEARIHRPNRAVVND